MESDKTETTERVAAVLDDLLPAYREDGMTLPQIEDFAILVAVRDVGAAPDAPVVYDLVYPTRQSFHRTLGLLHCGVECFSRPHLSAE